jgi:hypothetical protein
MHVKGYKFFEVMQPHALMRMAIFLDLLMM